MATVQPTVTMINDDVVRFQWTLTSTDNDGAPIGPQHASFADRTVQVTGTIGTASVLTIQGSNDGANWGFLNDAFGGDLNALAVNTMNSIAEVPLFTRPILGTPGSGATLVFTIVGRRNRPGKSIGG